MLSAAEAIEISEDIVTMVDEDVPEKAWDKAAEFFENARRMAVEIGESITQSGNVTAKQAQALQNIKSGVAKWIRD